VNLTMPNLPPLPKPTTEIPTLPPRAANTHKGQVGRVAIIAGSRGMTGAAILAGLGALRGGAGLVRIYCPASVQPVIAAGEPCFMTVPLEETPSGQLATPADETIRALHEWATSLAIGPGIGIAQPTVELLWSLIEGAQAPVVVDADGLNGLAEHPRGGLGHFAEAPTIVTPHPGEMARLRRAAGMNALNGDGDQTRLRIAHEFARHSGTTVVLKGHRSVVCTPDQAYINTTGNPGMATGGMGDVLTGLLAALLGQALTAFDAARVGVYCHGLAADLCAKRIGPVGYLARDVAELLPTALAAASNPRMGFK
jgi:NAD(P)H-hydrate epimerase